MSNVTCGHLNCEHPEPKIYKGSLPGLRASVSMRICDKHAEHARAEGWVLEYQDPDRFVFEMMRVARSKA